MRRRGFILNSVVLVLLIPILLLVATYEDISSSILQSQSERLQVEKTYRVVGYFKEDFENLLEISTRRALALVIDYVVTQKQFIDNASLAIEHLILEGTYIGSETNLDKYNKTKEFMEGYTIKDWFSTLREQLEKQGYVLVFPSNASDFANELEITVAPLDSFHIVVNASIPRVLIEDFSGKVIYNGSLDSVYAVVPIENMEDPLIAYLTDGGFSQVIRACNYPYPIINRPIIALEGFGYNSGRLSAPVTTSLERLESYKIYVGKSYIPIDDPHILGHIIGSSYVIPSPGDNRPIIYSTVINNTKISPTDVFRDGDFAAMIVEEIGTQKWCSSTYRYRKNFTVEVGDPGSIVLLKIPSSELGDVYHSGTLASLQIYEKSTCAPVPFWIEEWGDDWIYIWIKKANTDEYAIYYDTSPVGLTPGTPYDLFDLFDDFYDLINWEVLGNVTYADSILTVGPNTTASVLESKASFDYPIFVRYKMEGEGGGIALAPASKGENMIKVEIFKDDLPDYADIQIPIKITNQSLLQLIKSNSSLAEAEIKVYNSYFEEVPFWIEYWNETEALIWVRSDLEGSPTIFYIEYNTGNMTRGVGDQVFEFFDDFEDSTWEDKWEIPPEERDNIEDNIVQVNGTLIIKNGNNLLALRSKLIELYENYSVRFRMRPRDIGKDWDAGIGIEDKWSENKTSQLLLFTDDAGEDTGSTTGNKDSDENYLAIRRSWSGDVEDIDVPRGDNKFHTYEVQVFYYVDQKKVNNVKFHDITKNRVNEGNQKVQQPLYYMYLVLDNEKNDNWAYYDWIAVRKYLDESKLSYSISNVSEVPSVQYLDSSGSLKILRDWEQNGTSNGATIDYTAYYTYEVNFTYTSTNLTDNTGRFSLSQISDIPEGTPMKVQIIINSSQEVYLEVYFDWIAVGKYPYHVATVTLNESESKVGAAVGERNARAYNLQPFIDCLVDWRYFGIDGYPSFFERLEGSDRNREYYKELSRRMQEAVYGGYKYPIGLVSLVLPRNLPPNLAFLRGINQTAVDYVYLDLDGEYLYPVHDERAYKVLGISTNGGYSSPIVDTDFYLDPYTAEAIFGEQAACDLLEGYACG
ncbi:DUF2341 domain-containing protein [Thermococcus aggregans]|uniref:DUF2341 domain-containing protein n=1 Tax=Thermococcus aggregans TaxID=110163 RepID=A0A9E7MY53_THEAG|nr:DUF2341 domain-containing protein [Thermococcus aggregans]USS40985.1 DUF2341 domain-containing protein [Thermococcus aggregans]